jgi:predicted nucleic-acid-binding protein
MLGIDTNVLVRFLVRDDDAQFERAQRLIQRESRRGNPIFVSLLVLLETEWVLRSRYSLSRSEILAAFAGLLASVEIIIEDEPSSERALFLWKNTSGDFADCLIGARYLELGCRATASFDSRALRLPGFVPV